MKNDAKQLIHFRAIASVPCFELQLLLHHADVYSSLHHDEFMNRLKQRYPGYEIGAKRAHATTRERMPSAKQRAKALSASHAPVSLKIMP